ncbi:MAG: replication-associated recombination protein A [Desulfobacterales bacterium]
MILISATSAPQKNEEAKIVNNYLWVVSLDIFEDQARTAEDEARPLAEKMRPVTFEEFVGQNHVTGEKTLLRRAVKSDRLFSMILWGPPGCGKTTLAKIIAGETKSHFIHFSAVLSGVKDIRAVIEKALEQRRLYGRKTILFVDEIHRFNKSQQDAFLHHVESGLITLIGATTENPSFEIIAPLLSRCRVITLEQLSESDIEKIIFRTIEDPLKGLGGLKLDITSDALNYLSAVSDGDARAALNSLEALAVWGQQKNVKRFTLEDVENVVEKKALLYDKSGEQHFNLISAFHKSLRGSDPDASLYWLARMLGAGEDPLYVARRMVRFASEDIGNADPHALTVAMNAMEAYRFLGSPEGDLSLAHAAVYLATAPKSNRIYSAYKKALDAAKKSGSLPVPKHIRNAPTNLMKKLGYAKDYQYAHDFQDGYVVQQYLPEKLEESIFYLPTDRGYEKIIKQRLDKWRALKNKRKENISSSTRE